MTQRSEDTTLLVIDALPVPLGEAGQATLSSHRIPVAALRANMSGVLRDVAQMLADAGTVLGKCKIEYVDISLGISVDGSVGLLGSGVAGGAKGAINLRLKFDA